MPTVAGCLNNRKSEEEGWKRKCPWSVGDAGVKEGLSQQVVCYTYGVVTEGMDLEERLRSAGRLPASLS